MEWPGTMLYKHSMSHMHLPTNNNITSHCAGFVLVCVINNCVPPSKFPDLYCVTQDEVDFSWPWHKNILLELVRGTGLSPEVNISMVQKLCLNSCT